MKFQTTLIYFISSLSILLILLLLITLCIYFIKSMYKNNVVDCFEVSVNSINNYEDIFPLKNNPWINTSRNISYANNTLEVELKNNNNEWKYNKMGIHPLLADKLLINSNGSLTYKLTPKDDDKIMAQLFPLYTGPSLPSIQIDDCVMLSVDIPKYNSIRSETIKLLEDYKLPPLDIYYGYTRETGKNSRFYDRMLYPEIRNELTLGMLEIFENFVNKYPNKNAWMLYFEDDVRIVNLQPGSDVSILYNIPSNAELIRPYIGTNTITTMDSIKYKKSYNGGLNHALYISVSACKKVLKYAKIHKWKYICDVDLYRLAVGSGGFPTGIDGWSLKVSDNQNNISNLIPEEDKIHMYSMDHIIFNQTSLPCAPFK